MKKLMIAMAAIAVGLTVHAGAVIWNFNSVSASSDNALTAAGQYMAYLFIADATTAADSKVYSTAITQIGKGKDADLNDLTYYTVANTIFGKKGKFSSSNGSFVGSADALNNVSVFAVVIDSDSLATAKNYLIAKTADTSYSTDGIMLTQGFGAMGDKTYTWGSQASNTSWTAIGGGSSVPEPTSGMLLMFGLATLALRRRRA